MKNFRFNYIITIHNKQDLIRLVLEALLKCAKENSYIYPVLDGCTDNTEKVIDEVIKENPNVPIVKLYAPDVHELKTINVGLRAASQAEKGCNIILQDDVIIEEPDLEEIVYKIYEHFGYEKVGYIGFRHGVNVFLKDHPEISEILRKKEPIMEERDLVESAYGMGMSAVVLPPNHLIERMVSVGSPQCVSTDIIRKLGVMDESLAPHSYSCHDMSLRCLEAGLRNYVFALKIKSDIKWGGTRSAPPEKATEVYNSNVAIIERNKHYMYKKHFSFLEKFCKSQKYYHVKTARPFVIPGIPVSSEEGRAVIERYFKLRAELYSGTIKIISQLKIPLKWILVRFRLY
jgi:glycosyltransferase involved in cell wall biosynthesis